MSCPALEFSWLHSLPYIVLETLGDSCDLTFGVAVLWLIVLCGPDSPRLVAGLSSSPDVTVGKCRDLTFGRCLSLSHDGLLGCSYPFWAHSLELVSLGEFQQGTS